MKKFARLLSLLLIVCIVAPSVVALANSLNPIISGGSLNNANAGWLDTWGYRIGLGVCDQGEGIGDYGVTPEAKALAIEEYAKNRYTRIHGESAYLVSSGGGSASEDVFGVSCTPAQGALHDVLNAVVSRSANARVNFNGSYFYIVPEPDNINTIMSELASLGPINQGLYNRWLQEADNLDMAKHPVIIVVEVIGL